MSATSIDVGQCSDNERIFIAHPANRADIVKTPLTGAVKYVLTLSVPDACWLIEALQNELGITND